MCSRGRSVYVLQRARANVAEKGREYARVERVSRERMAKAIVRTPKARPRRLRRRSLNLSPVNRERINGAKNTDLAIQAKRGTQRRGQTKSAPARHESARKK